MASKSIQNFREWLNKSEPTEWLGQIVALTGALLGVTTWLYKELIIPNTAPVNIDLSTEVKSLTATAEDKPKAPNSALDSAVIKVTVKNPSSRKITLYGPRWILLGRRRITGADAKSAPDKGTEDYMVDRETAREFNDYQRQEVKNSEQFSAIQFTQNPDSLQDTARSNTPTRWELIAVGPLFGTAEIEGKATVSSQKAIFFVGSRYDMVESKILIPTTPSDSKSVRSSDLGYMTIFCATQTPTSCNMASKLNKTLPDESKYPDQVHAFLFQSWCIRPPYFSRFAGASGLSPHDLTSLYSLERLSPKGQGAPEVKRSKHCPTLHSTGDKDGKNDQELDDLDKLTSDEIKSSPKYLQNIGAQVFSTSLQVPTQKMTPSLK